MAELFLLKVYLFILTLLHSEQPKLYGVLAVLSGIGLKKFILIKFPIFTTHTGSAMSILQKF